MASTVKNCRFHLTSVGTRYGLQKQIAGVSQNPITGLLSLIYVPELPGEVLFQVPFIFDQAGNVQIETPLGSGKTKIVNPTIFVPPANAHMQGAQAYNKAVLAFSDLKTPLSSMAVYDLKTGDLDPYGQKPFGVNWSAKSPFFVGEMTTPTVAGGNGHTYQCTTAGTTGGIEPTWPTTENGTVTDGTVVWTELTPVFVNRLPAPVAPVITRFAGGGSFPAGRDVYVMLTYVNPQGETTPSVIGKLVNTSLNDAVSVVLPTQAMLPGWIRGLPPQYAVSGINVYEASVPTGTTPPPATSAFLLYGTSLLGTTVNIPHDAGGGVAPLVNTARVTSGGLQPPDAPAVTRNSASGSFPAGRDVYVRLSYTNTTGESLPSLSGVLVDTVATDAAQVVIPTTIYEITGVRVYEVDVPTGSPEPAASAYALVGSFAAGSTVAITASATGTPPKSVNTSGVTGSVQANVTGKRYAALSFQNRNTNRSGITQNATFPIDIDVPGFQIYGANLPIGPANVAQRNVCFTIADGQNAGPFFRIPFADNVSGTPILPSVISDNTTTTAYFDFTDQYLISPGNDVTDDFRKVLPPPAVDAYYSPSVDRVILSGAIGFASGHLISLAADAESYYGDAQGSILQVAANDGQKVICAREYRGILFSLKERSGHVITPNAANPSQWDVQERWSGVGPCGPRAVAVARDFMAFVHRSGLYTYTNAEPELMTREIANFWKTINWNYQHTIWINIDEEEQEIRIGLPTGQSTTPNVTLTMNYQEGTAPPIHFSPYIGKEIAAGECRKWSLDDIAGNLAVRVERALPLLQQVNGQFGQSQILIASSGPDGLVHAITPGIYNDNQAGIDCQYETACPADAMSVNQLRGVTANALGVGMLRVSAMVGRIFKTSQNNQDRQTREIPLAAFPLTPENYRGLSAGARGRNERFRLRFTNGKAKDAWFDLKWACLYTRPLTSARTGAGK